MNGIWDFVIDGLFVVFLVSIISGIAASSTSFNALLFTMFGGTAEQQLASVAYSWKTNLQNTISSGADLILNVTQSSSQVYPLATYIVVFALFIGSVLGIVVYAMTLISGARREIPVPVRVA